MNDPNTPQQNDRPTQTNQPPTGSFGRGTTGNNGALQTLSSAKARLGIFGMVIVIILALIFHVNPIQALSFFTNGQNQTTTQTVPAAPANR